MNMYTGNKVFLYLFILLREKLVKSEQNHLVIFVETK